MAMRGLCPAVYYQLGQRCQDGKCFGQRLWKRRESFFYFSSDSPVHVPYDPYTYSQNFDPGLATDPDNVSRSFSARFAVPSRIFLESWLVVDWRERKVVFYE